MPLRRARCILVGCLILGGVQATVAAELDRGAADPVDPLGSPGWDAMYQRYFKGKAVVFDDRVKVIAPATAEDALDVPVKVEAAGLAGVREITVIADLNPIQKILTLKPTRASPGLSFRFKVEQSTPIRAAMLTDDGVWHIGGVWLSAAGGGCTTPSAGSAGLWQGRVGDLNGRVWPRAGSDSERLRFRIVHPMDTGLASGIPAFYMSHVSVHDAKGAELASLDTFEPLSENPVISLDVQGRGAVRIDGADIQGNAFGGDITP